MSVPKQYLDPEIECASTDEMRQLQTERLKHMVKHAYENVPLYQERMDAMGVSPDDIHSIDDLHKLPFTVKDDLRNTYPFGMFAVPKEELVRIHASSGTTGKQTVVGYTKNDIDVWSRSVARALTSIGTTKSDYVHVSYGYGLFTGGLGLHYGAEYMDATAIPVSSGIQSAKYKFYRITVLIFYAVHLLTLCILEKLQEIWELIQSSFLYAQAFLALNLGQNTCVRSWRQF